MLSGVRPGISPHVLPPSTESQAHDMLRVKVGELVSGASRSCQFSLWAVAKILPNRSTTKLGSYPKPSGGVTFTGGPNVTLPCAKERGASRVTITRAISPTKTNSFLRIVIFEPPRYFHRACAHCLRLFIAPICL